MGDEIFSGSSNISMLEAALDNVHIQKSVSDLVRQLLANPHSRSIVLEQLQTDYGTFILTPAQVIRLLRRRKGGNPFRDNSTIIKAAYHILLTKHRGNVTAVAKEVGFDRRYITRHMVGLGVDTNNYRKKPYERRHYSTKP